MIRYIYEPLTRVITSILLLGVCLTDSAYAQQSAPLDPAEVADVITVTTRPLSEIWFKQTKTLTFHDPLAATTIFNDEICQFSRGKGTTKVTGKRSLGRTHWKPILSGPNEVATSVDSRKFFEHFFSVQNY